MSRILIVSLALLLSFGCSKEDELVISKTGTESDLGIGFPNPTTRIFNFRFHAPPGDGVIELYDIAGGLISINQLNSQQHFIFEITGPVGIYILRIKLDNGVTEDIRIIKQ